MNRLNNIYEFIDRADYSKSDDVASVHIREGEFEGVEFTFGVLTVNEIDNSATISFDYRIHNDDIEQDSETKERFEVLLGEILNDILYSALIEAERRYTDEHRKENSETPSE